jgi:hypothetical protein
VAILEAHCGFEENLDGMSFPLNDSLLERITHHEKHGKTASLSDDPGLVLLLSRRVGSSHCDAWPVTGGEGRLLGVLVVLSSGPTPERAHQLVHLDQIMKATGPAYERLTDV